MSNDQVLEEFKAAFRKEFGFDWAETTPVTDDGDATVMQVALWAWQASRAALVIDLPDYLDTDKLGFPAYDAAVVDAAIEAAGVKVKP
jgi:hypothetical protein